MADDIERDFASDEYDPYDPLDTRRAEVKTLSLQDAAEATMAQRLERRQQAYRRMFTNLNPEDLEIVANDLKWFCMGDSAVFHENDRIHALLTGRQEVWMRMQDHIRLDFAELVSKYIRPQPKRTE